jgi:AhpD family alkylhydroperoxidase
VSSQSHYAQFHTLPSKIPDHRKHRRWPQSPHPVNFESAQICAGSRRLRLLPFSRPAMSTFGLVEYKDASLEVRAVYDDIMATRKTDWINNFWKAIAHDPVLLKRTWEDIKEIMAPGAIDPLTKELIYVAVSVTNNCHYCIASHTASAVKKGMTPAMFKELQAVIGMANETNKLVTGYQVAIDEQFKLPFGPAK